MEEPNRQVHLGSACDYTKQLLKFFDFGVVGRHFVKIDHVLHNVYWVVSFEVLLNVRFILDWVGDRIEIPLLRKIPNDNIPHSMFKKATGQTSSTLPGHGIRHV